MKLDELLATVPFDVVVNIGVDNTIIDSFTVKDYFYDKRNKSIDKYHNCIVRTATFIEHNIISVQINKSEFGLKKELICYKDGSFTLDNKPFENIIELTNYLSWN